MNGSLVSNGQSTVKGSQANDHLIGCANGHFAAHANGRAPSRNHVSATDTAYPTFRKTLTGHRRVTEDSVNSATHEPKQNAEVLTLNVLMLLIQKNLKSFITVKAHCLVTHLKQQKSFGFF